MALLNPSRWPLILAVAVLAGCGTLNDAEVEEEVAVETGSVEGAITGALPVGTKLQAIYSTYLRRGPSSSYGAIAVVPAGEVVTVASSSYGNPYYYVSFRGQYGFVYGPYYRLASTSSVADAGSSTTPAPTPTTPSGVAANLRADVNRDGVVSPTDTSDEEGEDGWSASRGAVFLANIDDDQRSCRTTDSSGYALSDVELARCNDANDEVVNGSSDLLDLARLRVIAWTSAPSDATGTLSVSSAAATKVRLFRSNGSSFSVFKPESDTLSSAELRGGVELAIEAKDIVRNAASWDGYVTVTLRVRSGSAGVDSTDSVKLRVSPVMLFHHNTPVTSLYASNVSGSTDSTNFRSALQSILTSQGISNPLVSLPTDDQWAQDYFETGYAAMPSANGGQQVMRVVFRSANVQGSGAYPLRPAGRTVFTHMRGPDVAGVQQVDWSYDPSGQTDSLDSYGNTETIPPYTHSGVSYPLGRILRGAVSTFQPDPSQSRMFADQKMQPPVYVDTSWLLVGHVDEIFSFVPAATPRGWKLLVNDPTLAKQMLQAQVNAGYGNTRMFVGQSWYDDYGQLYSATVTINQVLADTEVMSESAKAAAEVDAQLAIIKAETGVIESEIIRVPFLHYPYSGYSLAYQPGTVNGVSLNAGTFIAPDPWGPVIGGKDIFKAQLENALAPNGTQVRWVDDWNLFHRNMGEVHCGSNAARAIPSTKWWETGR